MEITKELIVVSPTPTTLSSAIVAAQLSARLFLRRTESEGDPLDGKSSKLLAAKSSAVEGPSPGSEQGLCALSRCFLNPEKVP